MAAKIVQCPQVETPCTQAFNFARDEKSKFCQLCQKHVHNINALSDQEREALNAKVQRGVPMCVRYAYVLPVALALLGSGAAIAQDTADDNEELDEIVVTGGGSRKSFIPVLLESERTSADARSPDPTLEAASNLDALPLEDPDADRDTSLPTTPTPANE